MRDYLHSLVTASDVGLVDEDAGDGFLSSHLYQQILVVGAILYNSCQKHTL